MGIDKRTAISNDDIGTLKFDENGLIPVVTQNVETGKALSLTYMNKESLEISMREGRVCFFSRSRQALWRKGETSGNYQAIVNIWADCDRDALLVEVVPAGPACHTGEESCFYNKLYDNVGDGARVDGGDGEVSVDDGRDTHAGETSGTGYPGAIDAHEHSFTLQTLYDIIASRKAERPEGSYTTYLFDKGIEKILKKVGEESAEVIIASMKQNKDEIIYEAADLCYHMLVLLCETGIPPDSIMEELHRRHK